MANRTRNKLVIETEAAKHLSAWIVTEKGSGEFVARILSHYGKKSGAVIVDVYTAHEGLTYQGKAGGYGYDKLTAALAGAQIGDVKITDHCAVRLPLPEGEKCFPEGFKAPPGYRLANYRSELNGWTDCYKDSGIDGLRYKYEVYQVL